MEQPTESNVNTDPQVTAQDAAQTGAQPPQPATDPTWYDSIADDDLKAFISGKGFKDAGEAARALQELEGKSAVPESVDAYQLPVPEGVDAGFAGEAAKWMQEAGIPVGAAQTLAGKWNAYMVAQVQAAEQQRMVQGEADVNALKTEWGNQYDANVELGRRAVRTFGIDETALDAINQALGDAQTLRLFQRIGSHLGEATLLPSGAGGGQSARDTSTLEELMFPSMKT